MSCLLLMLSSPVISAAEIFCFKVMALKPLQEQVQRQNFRCISEASAVALDASHLCIGLGIIIQNFVRLYPVYLWKTVEGKYGPE